MRRDTNREWQSKSSYRMEDPYQDKRSGKLLMVCKLLPDIYQELQLYSKTSQWTQRKEEIEIGKEHQEAFEELKEKITSQSILTLLKREGKFWVETHASEYTIGGVLS